MTEASLKDALELLIEKWRNEALGSLANELEITLPAARAQIIQKRDREWGIACAKKDMAILADSKGPININTEAHDAQIRKEARLDENYITPHYEGCATLLATRDPYPECTCWVGARLADIEKPAGETEDWK